MKRLREERGVTLRSISDSTKISILTLEALERNDIARLPGGIFSRAVVRAYAQEVGIDPETTVRDFIAQFPHESVVVGSPHLSRHDLESDGEHLGRSLSIAAVVFVALAALGLIIWTTLLRK